MFSLKLIKGAELAEGVMAEATLPPALTRFIIGRDPSNHWPIPDRTLAISARHCELVATGSRVLLRDLSTNGTFVNGSPTRLVGEHVLKDGDRIEIGPYAFTVRALGAQAAAARGADVTVHVPPVAPSPSPPAPAAMPVRGGDPAAMLAAGAPAARVGLTEILRVAPPADDSDLAVTKIRLAPKAAASAAPAPTIPLPLPAPAPPPAAPPSEPLVAHLATAMGLPADALAGRGAAEAVAQVGALARAAVGALRLLMEQQAQSRRQLGSRGRAVRDVHPLRMADTPEAALRLLLAPGIDAQALLQRASAELAAHPERLEAAFRGAAARLGAELEPAALQQALGQADPAQRWALYEQLWQGMGGAPGQPWASGFAEAAALHLATVYDELGKT